MEIESRLEERQERKFGFVSLLPFGLSVLNSNLLRISYPLAEQHFDNWTGKIFCFCVYS